ncbi:MAG: AAA15 family ATPase/GTPase [Phenylobacterium sp.]|jgi:AAA15 family ATPase/GTPase
MKLDVQINNFGKIHHANIKLRPFTIITGPNNAGKSFIIQALHGFFNSVDNNRVSKTLLDTNVLLQRFFKNFQIMFKDTDPALLDSAELMSAKLDALEQCLLNCDTNGYQIVTVITDYLASYSIFDLRQAYKSVIELAQQHPDFHLTFPNNELNQLVAILSDPIRNLERSIEMAFAKSLLCRFGIKTLGKLKNLTSPYEDLVSLSFDQFAHVQFNAKGHMVVELGNINHYPPLMNLTLLESPVYWKIKSLSNLKKSVKNKSYNNIPRHFYHLLHSLDAQRDSLTTDANILSLIENLTDELGGEIDFSADGDLCFKLANTYHEVPLSATSDGTVQLGMLALLLKHQVINKEGIVFIDAPEMNLHPKWQKLLVTTLYQLSKVGITVVMASHSINIIKACEELMFELNGAQLDNHFGLNQLNQHGLSVNDELPAMDKMTAIMSDLESMG